MGMVHPPFQKLQGRRPLKFLGSNGARDLEEALKWWLSSVCTDAS